jgi:hypothetical protein
MRMSSIKIWSLYFGYHQTSSVKGDYYCDIQMHMKVCLNA